MRKRFVFLAPFIVLAFLAFIALGGVVVQALWNWLLPSLFGVPPLTFWQALGLLALCRILFGGLGGHGPGRRVGSRVRSRFRERMRERWTQLTPEERERFEQRLRERCGAGRSTGEPPEP